MIQIIAIETDKVEQLMKDLSNHFAREITVRHEGNRGNIEFRVGKCEITVTPSLLKFQAEEDTADGLDHVRRVVGNHLERFTPDEKIQINWKDHS